MLFQPYNHNQVTSVLKDKANVEHKSLGQIISRRNYRGDESKKGVAESIER